MFGRCKIFGGPDCSRTVSDHRSVVQFDRETASFCIRMSHFINQKWHTQDRIPPVPDVFWLSGPPAGPQDHGLGNFEKFRENLIFESLYKSKQPYETTFLKIWLNNGGQTAADYANNQEIKQILQRGKLWIWFIRITTHIDKIICCYLEWINSILIHNLKSRPKIRNVSSWIISLACLVLEMWRPGHFCDVTGQNDIFPNLNSINMKSLRYVPK